MSAPEPRTVLAGHLKPGRHGPPGDAGVTLCERRAAVIEVAARRGRAADLATILRDRAGLDLPQPGHAAVAAHAAALWIAPDTALLVGDAATLDALRAAIPASLAAAVDQSFGYAVLRLSGPEAPRALAKGCRVDLDPRAFAPGRVARTVVAQVPTILHRLDATPRFDLLVPSTLARSFADFLIEAAAEFGCEIGAVIAPDRN